MNYELAKQLKDAGFPQDGMGSFNPTGEKPYPYTPTLEELIEACGKQFTALQYYGIAKGFEAFALREYRTENNNRRTKELKERASTPIEAVANLWLALNKN